MDYVCKICGANIENNGHFFREHFQKISDYFGQYEPRLTIDGQKVIFKDSIERFFETDFNDLNARRKWIKENPEAGRLYFLELLKKRKEKKNWICAPGETELILSDLPKIAYFEKEFNSSFSDICKSFGLKVKFTNRAKDIETVDWAKPIEIIVDSREQKKLLFGGHISTEVNCLKYGDYSLKDNSKIVVERKSLSDLAGTLSAGFERFKREIERSKKDKGYIVIIVEDSFNNFKSIEYLPQTKHIKSSYNHLAKRARELYEQFNCFQLCFSGGRKESARIAEFVLKLGEKVKKIDLQLLIDKKVI